ncbi:MAG: hypothetical protein WCZ48_06010 [Bacillota bacterium]|jgi:8-oxo-dGTP pyrophosphatase MutT (NUDIX family)|nr:hypothetical protein [Bacillota bacterium]NLH88216.1 hypothetical protein [Bacillota bacterium]
MNDGKRLASQVRSGSLIPSAALRLLLGAARSIRMAHPALAGEDSAAACAREFCEEIGVEADMSKARFAFTVKRGDFFCDV